MKKQLHLLSGAILWGTSTIGAVLLLVLTGNILLGVWTSMRPLQPDRRIAPRPGHIPMWPVAAVVAIAYVSWLVWHLTQL